MIIAEIWFASGGGTEEVQKDWLDRNCWKATNWYLEWTRQKDFQHGRLWLINDSDMSDNVVLREDYK